MIASHLLNPSVRSNTLDSLSLEHLNYEMIAIEDLVGKGRNRVNINEIEVDAAMSYACENVEVIFKLEVILKNKLKESGLYEYFKNIEIALIDTLLNMEFEGTYLI